MIEWLRLAAHPATVKRALWTALVVVAILIAINHGAAILSSQMDATRIWQAVLTVFVPYAVSTVSSVQTRSELARRAEDRDKIQP
ncbi:MAG TPA: nitrate/nitrite transporter NrtS [Fimbriimonadaceae bacterium]|nr:nitrate/nitrite transporter NrtS [Fimbriimonadaceae bacterium]